MTFAAMPPPPQTGFLACVLLVEEHGEDEIEARRVPADLLADFVQRRRGVAHESLALPQRIEIEVRGGHVRRRSVKRASSFAGVAMQSAANVTVFR